MITLSPADVDERDRDALIAFLTAQTYPFHVSPTIAADVLHQRLDEGEWGGARDTAGDHRTFWVLQNERRVGVVRLDDITDDAPLFDLRLADGERGRGLGAAVLEAIAGVVFGEYPDVDRLEGQTREDNVAMRRVFVRAGWTKEAHYRRGWPVTGGEPVASVAYALLRSEWATGERIPLVWDDLPTA